MMNNADFQSFTAIIIARKKIAQDILIDINELRSSCGEAS